MHEHTQAFFRYLCLFVVVILGYNLFLQIHRQEVFETVRSTSYFTINLYFCAFVAFLTVFLRRSTIWTRSSKAELSRDKTTEGSISPTKTKKKKGKRSSPRRRKFRAKKPSQNISDSQTNLTNKQRTTHTVYFSPKQSMETIFPKNSPEQHIENNKLSKSPKQKKKTNIKKKMRSFSSVSTESSSPLSQTSHASYVETKRPFCKDRNVSEKKDICLKRCEYSIDTDFGISIPEKSVEFSSDGNESDTKSCQETPVVRKKLSNKDEIPVAKERAASKEEVEQFRRRSTSSNKYIYNEHHYNHTYEPKSYMYKQTVHARVPRVPKSRPVYRTTSQQGMNSNYSIMQQQEMQARRRRSERLNSTYSNYSVQSVQSFQSNASFHSGYSGKMNAPNVHFSPYSAPEKHVMSDRKYEAMRLRGNGQFLTTPPGFEDRLPERRFMNVDARSGLSTQKRVDKYFAPIDLSFLDN
eukprot:snap_masked-scaffold_25-processed-gene-2.47-mRNA-1 protein AED:1.00 eAED:1.00 QI:0/-1/0/0/-1/1/1/0/465